MKAGAVDPLRDALAYLAEASQRMEMRTRRREAGYVVLSEDDAGFLQDEVRWRDAISAAVNLLFAPGRE